MRTTAVRWASREAALERRQSVLRVAPSGEAHAGPRLVPSPNLACADLLLPALPVYCRSAALVRAACSVPWPRMVA